MFQKKCVIFTLEQWGHLSLCISLAKQLRLQKIDIEFGFYVPPLKTTLQELEKQDFKVHYNTNLLGAIINRKDDSDYFLQAFLNTIRLIEQMNPDFIICDSVPIAIMAARYLNISIYTIKRTNPNLFNEKFKMNSIKIINHICFSKNEWLNDSFNEISISDLALVPHPESFLPIDGKKVKYFKPSFYEKLEKDNMILDDKIIDILFVLTTSHDKSSLMHYIIQHIDNIGSMLNVVILNPFHHISCDNILSNVTIMRWANITKILKNTRMVISTGGHGICIRSIQELLPHIIIDIEEKYSSIYGSAVEKNGIGLFVKQNEKEIFSSIKNISDNYSIYKANCGKLEYCIKKCPTINKLIL